MTFFSILLFLCIFFLYAPIIRSLNRTEKTFEIQYRATRDYEKDTREKKGGFPLGKFFRFQLERINYVFEVN